MKGNGIPGRTWPGTGSTGIPMTPPTGATPSASSATSGTWTTTSYWNTCGGITTSVTSVTLRGLRSTTGKQIIDMSPFSGLNFEVKLLGSALNVGDSSVWRQSGGMAAGWLQFLEQIAKIFTLSLVHALKFSLLTVTFCSLAAAVWCVTLNGGQEMFLSCTRGVLDWILAVFHRKGGQALKPAVQWSHHPWRYLRHLGKWFSGWLGIKVLSNINDPVTL